MFVYSFFFLISPAGCSLFSVLLGFPFNQFCIYWQRPEMLTVEDKLTVLGCKYDIFITPFLIMNIGRECKKRVADCIFNT